MFYRSDPLIFPLNVQQLLQIEGAFEMFVNKFDKY